MNYNYHTHTPRCNHASGTPEEYIQRAIACGVRYMGFSDHAPSMFPAATQIKSRMQLSEAGDYVAELRRLRDKYRDWIDLKIGFEMEYYPHHFGDMLRIVKDLGIEYLILGQHYTREEGVGCRYVTAPIDDENDFKEHVASVVEGMQSGVFTYLAHPDVFCFVGDRDLYLEEMQKICVASKAYHVPLELNFYGIRDRRNYPNTAFWELVGEASCPVVFGFDSHDTPSAYDAESLKEAMRLVEVYRLNYIGKPDLVTL